MYAGTYTQARSQDLHRGGLFWKSEKCANDFDSNFHWTWISFRRFVRKLRRNFSESSEIQRFFPPKIRCSPKKKKKVFTEIESDFSAEIRNSKVFSAQNQMFSKKKGLHWNWEWFFGQIRKFKRMRGDCFPMGGGYFHKKSASKPPKTCDFAYFTSQWGGSSPPPPPLAMLLLIHNDYSSCLWVLKK